MAGFLSDKYKTSLNYKDLFDRVINLKLTAGVPSIDGKTLISMQEFVIRSDYEVYYPKLNVSSLLGVVQALSSSYTIRKCQMKPSIKISYQNVAGGTGIGIDIYISNFFMLGSDGQTLLRFNNETMQLAKVEVAMGYFPQFKEPATFTEWKDIAGTTGYGACYIVVNNCDYVTTDKLPPDSVLHIHGYVGTSITNPPPEDIGIEMYNALIVTEKLHTLKSSGKRSALESVLYKEITRRFLKESTQTLPVVAVAGYYPVITAEKSGVKVYLSNKLKEYSKNVLERKKKGSDDRETDDVVLMTGGLSMGQTLNLIRSTFGINFRYFITMGGNVVLYMADELKLLTERSVESFLDNDYYKDNDASRYWKNALPAVSNINYDGGLVTIVCPYYFFVDLFQPVTFSSRYSLSNLVQYFVNNGNSASFSAIKQLVSFATTEDINEMQLVCTVTGA